MVSLLVVSSLENTAPTSDSTAQQRLKTDNLSRTNDSTAQVCIAIDIDHLQVDRITDFPAVGPQYKPTSTRAGVREVSNLV
jgi:hypothetical protein